MSAASPGFEEILGSNGVRIVSCVALTRAGFPNAFSTRSGGVTAGGLNLSYKDDDRSAVDENRRRFLSAIGRPGDRIVTVPQIHSSRWISVDQDWPDRAFRPEADAVLTSKRGLLAAVKTADCVPVLVADSRSGAVAAVHAGWRGTLSRILIRSVRALAELHGARPRDMVAAIGPAACGRCYEVGDDVVSVFRDLFADTEPFLTPTKGGKALFDGAEANRRQLLSAGLAPENIHVMGACTIHENDRFFSYRREADGGRRPVGRLLSVVGPSASI